MSESTTSRQIRAICAGLCLLIGALLLPVGVVSFWGNQTLTDNQRFVNTVAPLAADQVIRDDIANVVVAGLTSNVQASKSIGEWIPLLGRLGTSAYEALHKFVYGLTQSFLASANFQAVWRGMMSQFQKSFESAVQGTPTGAVQLQAGNIVLDLSEVMVGVKGLAVEQGVPNFALAPLPELNNRQVVLVSSDQVSQLRFLTAVSQWWAKWLIVLAIASLGLALGLSRKRARMMAIIGLCVVIGGGVITFGIWLGAASTATAGKVTPFGPTIDLLYKSLTAYLDTASIVMMVIGVIMVALGVGWAYFARRAQPTLPGPV